jgi:hypothetical protein
MMRQSIISPKHRPVSVIVLICLSRLRKSLCTKAWEVGLVGDIGCRSSTSTSTTTGAPELATSEVLTAFATTTSTSSTSLASATTFTPERSTVATVASTSTTATTTTTLALALAGLNIVVKSKGRFFLAFTLTLCLRSGTSKVSSLFFALNRLALGLRLGRSLVGLAGSQKTTKTELLLSELCEVRNVGLAVIDFLGFRLGCSGSRCLLSRGSALVLLKRWWDVVRVPLGGLVLFGNGITSNFVLELAVSGLGTPALSSLLGMVLDTCKLLASQARAFLCKLNSPSSNTAAVTVITSTTTTTSTTSSTAVASVATTSTFSSCQFFLLVEFRVCSSSPSVVPSSIGLS